MKGSKLRNRPSYRSARKRWFERMAEYADVKKDAMNEYDDEILTLKSQLKLIEEND